MKELKVDFTLEEIKLYIREQKRYTLNSMTSTPRSAGDSKLLKSQIILSESRVKSTSYVVTYTAWTKDNYLVTTTALASTYGQEVFNEYFGLSSGGFMKVVDLFYTLPEECRNELIAKEWLAKNPETLVNKLKLVLEAPVTIIEEQAKTISSTEEMLVNAHHNMKKIPKKTFTNAWSRWDVLKKLPWFSECIEEELSNESKNK